MQPIPAEWCASVTVGLKPVESWHDEVDGQAIEFVTFKQDMDSTPMLKGLPNDQCPCPHWGYVLKGRLTYRFADRDEVFEAGDAFYLPPGHVPFSHEPGTEIVQFSPTGDLQKTQEELEKERTTLAPDALGVDVAPRLKVLKVEEPPKRKAGIKVKTVAELIDKLKNEAGVI